MALEKDVDETTLNAIASYPSGNYVVRKDFYNDDNRVEELVLYRMCGLPDPTPAPPSEQNFVLFLVLIFYGFRLLFKAYSFLFISVKESLHTFTLNNSS